MSSSQSTDSPQVRLVRECILGLTKNDLDTSAKLLHKDYRRIIYPRSLGKPVVAREEWLEQCGKMVSHWIDPEITFHSIIDAPRKVVVHLTCASKTSFGVDLSRELISIFSIVTDDDGSLKIVQVEEFIDSKSHLDQIQAFTAARANE